MNCKEISLSLPWYLNRSLSDAEQARITEHLTSCETCHHELEETAWLVKAIAEHATHRELIDLVRANQLSDDQAIERHLEVCPRCSDKKELIELMANVPEVTQAPSQAPATPPSRSTPFWRSWAVAATLTTIVGAGAWIHEEIRPMAPQATKIVVFEPKIVLRSTQSAAETTVVELNAEQPLTTLLYPLSASQKFTRFSAQLSANGKVLWQNDDWHPNERQGLAVTLPTSILHADIEHVLELQGWSGDRSEEIDRLTFFVHKVDDLDLAS